jgi:hypothetical protein
MAFRERSAWVMACMYIVLGGFYLKLIIHDDVTPSSAAVTFVLLTVVLSITAQIVLAITLPREASRRANEQELLIIEKAAHFSSYVLSSGVIVGLGLFMVSQNGMKLFHIVFTSLILGQLAKYAAQLFLLRVKV